MRPQAQGLWKNIHQPYGVWFFGNGNDLAGLTLCVHSGVRLQLLCEPRTFSRSDVHSEETVL